MSVDVFSKLGVGWLGDLLSNNVLNMFVISIILSWALPDSMHISFLHRNKKVEIKAQEELKYENKLKLKKTGLVPVFLCFYL